MKKCNNCGIEGHGEYHVNRSKWGIVYCGPCMEDFADAARQFKLGHDGTQIDYLWEQVGKRDEEIKKLKEAIVNMAQSIPGVSAPDINEISDPNVLKIKKEAK